MVCYKKQQSGDVLWFLEVPISREFSAEREAEEDSGKGLKEGRGEREMEIEIEMKEG